MAPKRRISKTANTRTQRALWRKEVMETDPLYFHRSQMKSVYGLDYTQYEAMLTKQKGVCALCYQPNQRGRRLAVDHDHETGQVRALLCNRCNVSLGRHNLPWFGRAIQYLIKYVQVPKMEE